MSNGIAKFVFYHINANVSIVKMVMRKYEHYYMRIIFLQTLCRRVADEKMILIS